MVSSGHTHTHTHTRTRTHTPLCIWDICLVFITGQSGSCDVDLVTQSRRSGLAAVNSHSHGKCAWGGCMQFATAGSILSLRELYCLPCACVGMGVWVCGGGGGGGWAILHIHRYI